MAASTYGRAVELDLTRICAGAPDMLSLPYESIVAKPTRSEQAKGVRFAET